MRFRQWIVGALATATLVGCATVDPRGAFEATREGLAGRHPGEVVWRRIEGSGGADERVRQLLAAPLGLDAAAEVTLLRNPALQATLEELGIAQADLAQATRLANPGLSFASLRGAGERQWTVGLTTDIVDALALPLRRKVAAAELERVKLEVGRSLLDAVAEARLALVRYQAAEKLAERLAKIEEIARAGTDYARALHAAGNLTALERANAEAEWAETRAELRRIQAQAARRREAVTLTLGLAGDETWSAAADLPAPLAMEVDSAALEATALRERLDLAAARWAITALERALALRRRTRFLPLGVELGIERERETDGVRLTGPVVELRLPIFDTGKASVARLTSELAAARWQLVALEGQARAEVRERSTDLAAARELVVLYRDTILPLRLEVLELTLREHNQMLVGTFDLLLARRHEIDAERRSIEALLGYWEARIELERAVGGPFLDFPGEPETEPTSARDHHPAVPSGGPEDEP